MKVLNRLTRKLQSLKSHDANRAVPPVNPNKVRETLDDTFNLATGSSRSASPPLTPTLLRTPNFTLTAPQPSIKISDDTIRLKFADIKSDVARGLQSGMISTEIAAQLSELLSARPNSTQLLTLRAIAYRLNGQVKECVDDCNQILILDPTNKFALLHRLSAVSSERFEPYANYLNHAKYLIKAQREAALTPNDRLSLFTMTIFLENIPGSINIAKQLQHDYIKNPKDTYLGTVLMSAYLSRRIYRICDEDRNKIREATNILLTHDPKNTLAHEVLYQYFKQLKPRYAEDIPPNYVRIFADFPLVQQDDTLDGHVRELELT